MPGLRGAFLQYPQTADVAHHYNLISEFYGDRVAERSQVPLMHHVDQGVAVLKALNAGDATISAFCVHPLIQADADLTVNLTTGNYQRIDPLVAMYAMEYRNKANAYLCTLSTDSWDLTDITDRVGLLIQPVHQMLVADKVQNFKDFLTYHGDTHNRRDHLRKYFTNWLLYLGVNDKMNCSLLAAIDRSTNPVV